MGSHRKYLVFYLHGAVDLSRRLLYTFLLVLERCNRQLSTLLACLRKFICQPLWWLYKITTLLIWPRRCENVKATLNRHLYLFGRVGRFFCFWAPGEKHSKIIDCEWRGKCKKWINARPLSSIKLWRLQRLLWNMAAEDAPANVVLAVQICNF